MAPVTRTRSSSRRSVLKGPCQVLPEHKLVEHIPDAVGALPKFCLN